MNKVKGNLCIDLNVDSCIEKHILEIADKVARIEFKDLPLHLNDDDPIVLEFVKLSGNNYLFFHYKIVYY